MYTYIQIYIYIIESNCKWNYYNYNKREEGNKKINRKQKKQKKTNWIIWIERHWNFDERRREKQRLSSDSYIQSLAFGRIRFSCHEVANEWRDAHRFALPVTDGAWSSTCLFKSASLQLWSRTFFQSQSNIFDASCIVSKMIF